MTAKFRAPFACYAVTLGVVIGSLAQAQSPPTINVDPNSFRYTNCFGYRPNPYENVGCGCCGGIPHVQMGGPMTQFAAAQQLAAQRLGNQPGTNRPQGTRKHRLSCNGQTFYIYSR